MTVKRDTVIEFRGFEKWYGKICAVKSLNLTVATGETFALLGPNGSGKSTVIRALAGLHFPTAGEVRVLGQDLTHASLQLKQRISYMPQRVAMPENLTAREIVTLFARLRGASAARVEEVLDFVELGEHADRYTREYSGGMLQRVGLAIALLSDADLYVLDEPTLNLDASGIKRLRSYLSDLKQKGKTVLFSSHILQDAVQLADRVGILVNGRLAKIESVPEFKEEVARETRVRIVLSRPLNGIRGVIEAAGAESTAYNGRSCTFKAPPDARLSVIRAIEAAGGVVEEFHTEPPNWETLLHQELEGKNGCHGGT